MSGKWLEIDILRDLRANFCPQSICVCLVVLSTFGIFQRSAEAQNVDIPEILYRQIGVQEPLFDDLNSGTPDLFFPARSGAGASITYRIRISDQGVYRITRSQLDAAGIPAADQVGEHMRIFNRDREIPIRTSTESQFGPADFVWFYAEGWTREGSEENVYWLTLDDGPQPPLRIPTRTALPVQGLTEVASYPKAERHDPNAFFQPQFANHDNDIDHFFSDIIAEGMDRNITLPVNNAVAGPATLHVEAGPMDYDGIGNPFRTLGLEHVGRASGSLSIQGNGSRRFPWDLPSGVFNGNNTFTLTGVNDLFFISALTLVYPRRLVPEGDRLAFSGRTGAFTYRVDGLASGRWTLLNVSNPLAPVQLSDLEFTGGANQTLRFSQVAGVDQSFLLMRDSARPAVANLEAVGTPDLHETNQRADYLILVDSQYFTQSSIDRLANHRRAEGLSVKVVELQDIYDQFGYGLREPGAIKNFLGYVYHHWRQSPPRFVVLLGDASVDPLNSTGAGQMDMLPTKMLGASFAYTACDLWYGQVDRETHSGSSDHLNDMMIARIPARNSTELNRIVDKIQAHENASWNTGWRFGAAFIADDADGAGNFKARCEELRADYFTPNGITSTASYYDDLNQATMRNHVLSAFNGNQAGQITYVGHGSVTTWTDIFGVDNLPSLNNAVFPVVNGFACDTGAFQTLHANGGLNENLLRSPGGAVAGMGATAEALEITASKIAHGYFRARYTDRKMRLGDQLQAGFDALFAFSFGFSELDFYSLQGDPALVANPIPNQAGDADGDGLPNGWEVSHLLEPWITSDASEDPDRDGLRNSEEFQHGTHPQDEDSDADGLLDSWEVVLTSNPNDIDSDGDGLPDAWEWENGTAIHTPDAGQDTDNDSLNNAAEFAAGTHASYADTDSDGLTDDAEQNTYGSDPLNKDSDNDGLLDGDEVNNFGTDPMRADSNGDGIPDGWGGRPFDPADLADPTADSDDDGLSNLEEANAGTNPLWPDSDSDGLDDAAELRVHGTDPLRSDSDADGLSDSLEVDRIGSSPTSADTDQDGMGDFYEFRYELNPLIKDGTDDLDSDQLMNLSEAVLGTMANDPDTDSDGLLDGAEVQRYGTDPLRSDTDGDLLRDGAEIDAGANPHETDTDGDGLDDRLEVSNQLNPASVDTDGDGMDDEWEWENGLDPRVNDRLGDPDSDGLSNIDEFAADSDPQRSDTDFDTLSDGAEVHQHNTDPSRRDTDGDGANDNQERMAGSNPRLRDSDGDGMLDGYEIHEGLNPLVNDAADDPDADTLSNLQESQFLLDPFDPDSDDDGLGDAVEAFSGPSGRLGDTDSDGLRDGEEVNQYGTSPNDRDSDDDGLRDGEEVDAYGTNPLKKDSDADGMEDGYELIQGLNPLVPDGHLDPDSDGLTNLEEMEENTDPDDSDSDNDGLIDGAEVKTHLTNPNQADTDADGLEDGAETNPWNTSPNQPDSDGDLMIDGWEVTHGLNPLTADPLDDPDMDGIPNLQEFVLGTHPNRSDSDGDGLDDLLEQLIATDANLSDTDGDGMPDAYEVEKGFDPRVDDGSEDADGDGHANTAEFLNGSDPNDPKSILALYMRLSDEEGKIHFQLRGKSDRHYRLLGTRDLSLPFQVLRSHIDGAQEFEMPLDPNRSIQFYRLETE